MTRKNKISNNRYIAPSVTLSDAIGSRLMGGSIVLDKCNLTLLGHEIGEKYDFSKDEFNHDWVGATTEEDL